MILKDGLRCCYLYTSLFSIRSKGNPGGCEVGHSSDSDPYRLRARRQFRLTIVVATELCQQGHEFRERWRCPGKRILLDHEPDRLPFAIIEHSVAWQRRTFSVHVRQVHDSPRDDFVKGQAVLQSRQRLQLNLFHTTAGLEDTKEHFDLPVIVPP